MWHEAGHFAIREDFLARTVTEVPVPDIEYA
jgi:hypothetical protein